MDFDPEDREDANSAKQSDNEESEKEEVGGLITDIFGASDEEEEFEGFGEADIASHSKKDRKGDEEDEGEAGNDTRHEDFPDVSDDEERRDDDGERSDKIWDFDVMMDKRKSESRKRRRRNKDVDFINDSDDMIDNMIKMMKEAVERDRELNRQKKPAIAVMQQLEYAKYQLKKVDLHQAFLDSGILTSIAEWLAPLPNRALPHHEIREVMLRQLAEFPTISTEGLKMSGLGKAVMYLLKHPKEIAKNKQLCRKLINDWARPIFNQSADYKDLTKEERQMRDHERLPKKRKLSSEGDGSEEASKGSDADKILRPGDPGYVYRARVPAPSIKDYVIRPRWGVEEKPREAPNMKRQNKLAKLQRSFMDKKKGQPSGVRISIEGRNMKL